MVMRNDVISNRWSSQFWVTIHVFSTFFNNESKINLAAKIMQTVYLCVIFNVFISRGFNLISNSR